LFRRARAIAVHAADAALSDHRQVRWMEPPEHGNLEAPGPLGYANNGRYPALVMARQHERAVPSTNCQSLWLYKAGFS